jgi:hypothetical protein
MSIPPQPPPAIPVPGADRHEQAVRIAGALAELGMGHVEVIESASVTKLPSRATDLPGLLDAAPNGLRLRVPATGLAILVESNGLVWMCPDADAAFRFAQALGLSAPTSQK